MNAHFISSKEIVKKYGLPYSTINYYTVVGLLTVAGRKRNVRLYDEAQIKQRLEAIAHLRSKGYPLLLIQQELINKNASI